MDWQKYWASYPKNVGETEFLKQVGKTVQGQPISDIQFRQIVSEISERLELQDRDIVLDLCCGNGLITNEIAKVSQYVIGVDYSFPLINIARKYHNPENVRYLNMSVLDLKPRIVEEVIGESNLFTKVYMYEGLQHFRKEDLAKLLGLILEISTDDVIILFGSVPDSDRLWKFYNTARRRLAYFKRKLQGREAIGTWWERAFIQQVCDRMNLRCEFFQQHEILHTSHYRFDFRVVRGI